MTEVLTPEISAQQVGAGRGRLVLGECVQGWSPEWGDFMITAPINHFSSAQFVSDPEADGLSVSPAGFTKSLQVANRYLEILGQTLHGTLFIENPMPLGHGFGTSTADITGSLRAVSDALGKTITPEDISRLSIELEPTDGSMYAEAVVYAYRRGELLEPLGELPKFVALVLLSDQSLDTVDYEQRRANFRYTEAEVEQIRKATELVRQAIDDQDVSLMAQGTTLSAKVNERFLPKEFFAEVQALVERGLGEGVIASHSGSAFGFVLNPFDPEYSRKRDEALKELENLGSARLIEVTNF